MYIQNTCTLLNISISFGMSVPLILYKYICILYIWFVLLKKIWKSLNWIVLNKWLFWNEIWMKYDKGWHKNDFDWQEYLTFCNATAAPEFVVVCILHFIENLRLLYIQCYKLLILKFYAWCHVVFFHSCHWRVIYLHLISVTNNTYCSIFCWL